MCASLRYSSVALLILSLFSRNQFKKFDGIVDWIVCCWQWCIMLHTGINIYCRNKFISNPICQFKTDRMRFDDDAQFVRNAIVCARFGSAMLLDCRILQVSFIIQFIVIWESKIWYRFLGACQDVASWQTRRFVHRRLVLAASSRFDFSKLIRIAFLLIFYRTKKRAIAFGTLESMNARKFFFFWQAKWFLTCIAFCSCVTSCSSINDLQIRASSIPPLCSSSTCSSSLTGSLIPFVFLTSNN